MYIEEAKVKDDIAREAESDADRAQREEMERIEREAEEALAMEKAKRIAEEEMKRVLRARDLKAHEAREVRERKTRLLRYHFQIQTIILPRQARSKHRDSTQQEAPCLIARGALGARQAAGGEPPPLRIIPHAPLIFSFSFLEPR